MKYRIIPFDPNVARLGRMDNIPILTLQHNQTNEVIYVCKTRLRLPEVEWDGYAEFHPSRIIGLDQVKGMSEDVVILLAEHLKEERDKQKRIDDMTNTLISLGQQEIQPLS